LDIIDLEKEDLLRVPSLSAEQAERVLRLIESLTVEEGATEEAAAGPSAKDLAEARELAADILALKPAAESKAAAPPRSESSVKEDESQGGANATQ
jgi:hypothetical protein